MVNKYLRPRGGSETYMLRLGAYLEQAGHEVQYFGMEEKGRCVGNAAGSYTRPVEFHGGFSLPKAFYPLKTVYSAEARRKLRRVLEDFRPQVCHLQNFNYQLTPSILLELHWWRKKGNACRIIHTAHDFQLVCPNHMCRDPRTGQNCEKCLDGRYRNCIRNRCIHGSLAGSLAGAAEGMFWRKTGVYRYLDEVICCSEFQKLRLDRNPLLAGKTSVMHNFIDRAVWRETQKKGYVLYFGRYAEEKGIRTLLQACRELPEIPFVFAGSGPEEKEMEKLPNVKNAGFLEGEALEKLIREASFSVCPSEWYENCPFSVMESQMYGTPVLGASAGGIPELVEAGKRGELFESGNAEALKAGIRKLWEDPELLRAYSRNCRELPFDDLEGYTAKLLRLYTGEREKAGKKGGTGCGN